MIPGPLNLLIRTTRHVTLIKLPDDPNKLKNFNGHFKYLLSMFPGRRISMSLGLLKGKKYRLNLIDSIL